MKFTKPSRVVNPEIQWKEKQVSCSGWTARISPDFLKRSQFLHRLQWRGIPRVLMKGDHEVPCFVQVGSKVVYYETQAI